MLRARAPSLLPTPSDGRGRRDGQRADRGSNEEEEEEEEEEDARQGAARWRRGHGRHQASHSLHRICQSHSSLAPPSSFSRPPTPSAIQSVSLSLSPLHNCQKVINRRRRRTKEEASLLSSFCLSVSLSIVKPCTHVRVRWLRPCFFSLCARPRSRPSAFFRF